MHSLDFSDSVKFQLLIKDAGAVLFYTANISKNQEGDLVYGGKAFL